MVFLKNLALDYSYAMNHEHYTILKYVSLIIYDAVCTTFLPFCMILLIP